LNKALPLSFRSFHSEKGFYFGELEKKKRKRKKKKNATFRVTSKMIWSVVEQASKVHSTS
jgi:hypothetical protein